MRTILILRKTNVSDIFDSFSRSFINFNFKIETKVKIFWKDEAVLQLFSRILENFFVQWTLVLFMTEQKLRELLNLMKNNLKHNNIGGHKQKKYIHIPRIRSCVA